MSARCRAVSGLSTILSPSLRTAPASGSPADDHGYLAPSGFPVSLSGCPQSRERNVLTFGYVEPAGIEPAAVSLQERLATLVHVAPWTASSEPGGLYSSDAVVYVTGPLQSCHACTFPSGEVVLRTGTRYRSLRPGFGDLIAPCAYPHVQLYQEKRPSSTSFLISGASGSALSLAVTRSASPESPGCPRGRFPGAGWRFAERS